MQLLPEPYDGERDARSAHHYLPGLLGAEEVIDLTSGQVNR